MMNDFFASEITACSRPMLMEFSVIQLCPGTCEGPGMCETKAVLQLTYGFEWDPCPALLRP